MGESTWNLEEDSKQGRCGPPVRPWRVEAKGLEAKRLPACELMEDEHAPAPLSEELIMLCIPSEVEQLLTDSMLDMLDEHEPLSSAEYWKKALTSDLDTLTLSRLTTFFLVLREEAAAAAAASRLAELARRGLGALGGRGGSGGSGGEDGR